MMTIDEAHMIATAGDRILRIRNRCSGYWYQDHVVEFVIGHKNEECRLILQTPQIVTVELMEDEKMSKIKAIIKRPDEPFGHMTWISDSLENLQSIVGGKIQVVPVDAMTALIINEEGKLLDLEHNFYMTTEKNMDIIVGTAIVVGTYEDKFVDCPLSMRGWKEILEDWGNR